MYNIYYQLVNLTFFNSYFLVAVEPIARDLKKIDESQKKNSEKIKKIGDKMQNHSASIEALKKDLKSIKDRPNGDDLEKKGK